MRAAKQQIVDFSHQREDILMQWKNLRFMSRLGLVLGCVSVVCIVIMFVLIRTDLPSIVNFHDTGYLLGAGYLWLLLYHGYVFLYIIRGLIRDYALSPSQLGVGFLGIVSLFTFVIEKVMFDEVAREIEYESPFPGEIVFIYGALGLHVCFVVLASVVMMHALQTKIEEC